MGARRCAKWKTCHMMQTHRFRVRAWIVLAAACAGGLLPGTCMIRTKDAVVSGTKTFLADVLLNPENLSDIPFEDLASDLTGS